MNESHVQNGEYDDDVDDMRHIIPWNDNDTTTGTCITEDCNSNTNEESTFLMDWNHVHEQQERSNSNTADTSLVIPMMTRRPPKILYLSCDADYLNDYQCLIRKNMELFEATPSDVEMKIRGRNKPIVLGQVGLRCIHCKPVSSSFAAMATTTTTSSPPPKGSVYYPQSLLGIYQAAQVLANGHWVAQQDVCTQIPPFLKQQMWQLKQCTTVANQPSQGKEYWATNAAVLDVVEHSEWGLRFKPFEPPASY
jgi:hypothetical protein